MVDVLNGMSTARAQSGNGGNTAEVGHCRKFFMEEFSETGAFSLDCTDHLTMGSPVDIAEDRVGPGEYFRLLLPLIQAAITKK